MRTWGALLLALQTWALGACHPNSFVFENSTGHDIVLIVEKNGAETPIHLARDGELLSLPGIRAIDRVRYSYGDTTCQISDRDLKLQREAWNEAQVLRLLPCDVGLSG